MSARYKSNGRTIIRKMRHPHDDRLSTAGIYVGIVSRRLFHVNFTKLWIVINYVNMGKNVFFYENLKPVCNLKARVYCFFFTRKTLKTSYEYQLYVNKLKQNLSLRFKFSSDDRKYIEII